MDMSRRPSRPTLAEHTCARVPRTYYAASATAIVGLVIFALYACRQQLYMGVNEYIMWSESLGYVGLLFVAFGMFATQILPLPFLFIGLCITSTFSLGFLPAISPLCIGTVSGMAFAWFLCHSNLRPFILSKLENVEAMHLLHKELVDHHWKIIVVMRLSPIPIGLQNVMLGLVMTGTEAFWRYVLGSSAIIIPEILIYMLAGSTMKDISEFMVGHVQLGPWEQFLLVLQMAGAVAFFWGVYRYGSKVANDVYAKIVDQEEQMQMLQSQNQDFNNNV
eukprot:TRINITY_DN10018_c0_g1_i1.p1 TRINITY_DN10018_c0_g1~~TRINITY_DN10018_c0_g1_i1.p1  ORF type:complete len:277 (+),score=59.78 TRINITY_DN10018_c0_g1_i1:46-876(+)